MDEAKEKPEQGSRTQEVAEFVKRFCVALTNVQMYGPDHPRVRVDIDAAYECLKSMQQERPEPVMINVMGKKILLGEITLEERNPLVARLAAKFSEIHVTTLCFALGLTAEDFVEFFRIMSKGPKTINAAGGMVPLLQAAGIKSIDSREVSYVVVTADQKVVSKDARVVDGDAGTGGSGGTEGGADAEVAKYMVGKVLKTAEKEKWLLDEMKNNPERTAKLISEGINLAASREAKGESGEDDRQATMKALLDNIRTVGQNLVDDQTGEIKEGEQDLEKAVMTLENEVRTRCGKLTSSGVAAGFINEILSTIAAYSDRVRAKHLSREFLKGERRLERAEKLIRDLTPATESPEEFFARMQQHLLRLGMSEADLEKILDEKAKAKAAAEAVATAAAEEEAKAHAAQQAANEADLAAALEEAAGAAALEEAAADAAAVAQQAAQKDAEALATQQKEEEKRRTRRAKRAASKPYSKPVADGIRQRLQGIELEGEQLDQLVHKLALYLEERARYKAREVADEADEFRAALERIARVLDSASCGIILWDSAGNVILCNKAAHEALGREDKIRLSDSLRMALEDRQLGLRAMSDPELLQLSEPETRLLRCIKETFADERGKVYAVICATPTDSQPESGTSVTGSQPAAT